MRWWGLGDGSGIIWTICKQSAPRCGQITTPTPHHSAFTGSMFFMMPNQQCHWSLQFCLTQFFDWHFLRQFHQTQPVSWRSSYRPTEVGRHCSKGVQPMPKAAYRSGCCCVIWCVVDIVQWRLVRPHLATVSRFQLYGTVLFIYSI